MVSGNLFAHFKKHTVNLLKTVSHNNPTHRKGLWEPRKKTAKKTKKMIPGRHQGTGKLLIHIRLWPGPDDISYV